MRGIQAASSEHHARGEWLLFLHVELAVDHGQRHIVITFGIVHCQFVISAFQMLTEQVARILVLERFVNTIITATRAIVQTHQGVRTLRWCRLVLLLLMLLLIIEHLLYRVALLRRVLYILVVVPVGMLQRLVEVSV